MSPKSEDHDLIISDDSDEEDLLTFSRRLSKKETSRSAAPATAVQEDEDEDPDWVRDFSQPNDAQEDRRRALTSVYDADDDSLVDLTSDKEEPVTQDVKAENEPDIEDQAAGAKQKGDSKHASKRTGAKAQQPRAPAVPKDSLPLVFAPKLDESLVLVQGDDDALDLSGDVGAVGRVKIDDGKLLLDIKGVLYSTQTYPTNSMCLVSVGDDEARVTAVLDEAVLLTSERDILASEEVVAGTLDEDENTFSADDFSDDEKPVKEKRTGAKADRAPKAALTKAKKKATPAKKPRVKTTGAGGPSKSITKTPRKKSTK